MSTLEKSAEAYRQANASGLIKRRQREAYLALSQRGPMSARALSADVPGAWKRLSELRALGLAKEVGSAMDPATRKNVTLWAVAANGPSGKPKRPQARGEGVAAQLRARVAALEVQVQSLTLKLQRWGRPTNAKRRERQMASLEAEPILFGDAVLPEGKR